VSNARIRATGGGRKLVEENNPEIVDNIIKIIDDSTYGDPTKILSYTTESLRSIQKKLEDEYSIKISHRIVGEILESLDYSKQANQKMLQIGEQHPDRNEQFEHINTTAKSFIENGQPVISVDTKKKENLGNFANKGKEYRNKKESRKVLDHDFPIEELGKVVPYGVYNLNKNTGFVNLGTSHDTAEFAVNSVSIWWETVGKNTFPNATKLYITCDCGGSNGYRLRMWKWELWQLAIRTGLEIHVSHYPPGTSKWNKVEHRLFCYISKSWAGKPLIDIETTVKLISSTSTTKGLSVICKHDENIYELGQKVNDSDFDSIGISNNDFHGEWNYSFSS